MRINKLYMKNFAPPFYSLGKSEIILDYTQNGMENKSIFIFVGRMGSCKTFLLGHHQPFATLGTVDTRNGTDMILKGQKGLKRIEFQNDDVIYDIEHQYTPSKDTHSVKSYIKKNGIELNPNGNVGSFEAVIEAEFGIEQNFLKLFRIGANVMNFLDMSPTERKAFISSMLKETEVFLHLYKKIGEKVRSTDAQMKMLLNRLRSISTQPMETLQKELSLETSLLEDLNAKFTETTKEHYKLEADIESALNGVSYDTFKDSVEALASQYEDAKNQSDETNATLDSIKDAPDSAKLSADIAAVNARCEMRQRTILSLSTSLDEHTKEKSQILDKLAVLGSSEHIETLRKTYNELNQTLQQYEKTLNGFTYSGTIASMEHLLSECRVIDGLISQLCQYNLDALRDVFREPWKATSKASNAINQLAAEEYRLSCEMNNLKRIGLWEPTHIMLRPFRCPTKDCPYFLYHPYTEQQKQTARQLDQAYLDRKNRLADITAKRSHYEVYPTIAMKISELKKTWERVYAEVDALGAIIEHDLETVIYNPTKRQWYNVNRLMRIKELCGIREKYYELTQQMSSMKNDLAVYEMSDRDSLEERLRAVMDQITKERDQLSKIEAENRDDERYAKDLNDLYLKVARLEQLRELAESNKHRADDLHSRLLDARENLSRAEEYMNRLKVVDASLEHLRQEYLTYEESCSKLKRKIGDVEFTQAQYTEVSTLHDILKDIMEAVSAKNGIPLAYVKIFLAECKDTINDLISDIFADHLEIQDFDIPENGTAFNIPYTKNGSYVQDVTKASQGERGIISIALPFSLIRQRDFPYNIMLLDEPDAPLYKEDRNKLIQLLLKQIQAINAEQVFIISHNNIFEGWSVGVIMTTDEVVDESPLTTIIRV